MIDIHNTGGVQCFSVFNFVFIAGFNLSPFRIETYLYTDKIVIRIIGIYIDCLPDLFYGAVPLYNLYGLSWGRVDQQNILGEFFF